MEKIKLKMKNGYILVKELSNEHTTPSGIILPQDENNRKAIVLSASEDSSLSKGDIVIRTVGNGTPMNINGHDLEMIGEGHIMAVIKTSKEDAKT